MVVFLSSDPSGEDVMYSIRRIPYAFMSSNPTREIKQKDGFPGISFLLNKVLHCAHHSIVEVNNIIILLFL
jgi:hypothetical protein